MEGGLQGLGNHLGTAVRSNYVMEDTSECDNISRADQNHMLNIEESTLQTMSRNDERNPSTERRNRAWILESGYIVLRSSLSPHLRITMLATPSLHN
jgi:hypothetical protein